MKKILICDDEKDIREILEITLEMEFDLEILHAANGEEGIEIYEAEDDIDVIICDYNMPKKNGKDFYIHNKDNKNIPFVLLSGNHDDVDFQPTDTNPKNKVIAKPWSGDEICESLEELLKA